MELKSLTDEDILQMQWDILEQLKQARSRELDCEVEIDETKTFSDIIKENPKPKRKSKKGYRKGVSIKEMAQFKRLKQPRVYDRKTCCWTNKFGNRGHAIYLPFEDLIRIIEDYRNGVRIEETFERTHTKHKTPAGLQNIQYIYRAGGFNEGIYENARRYNYRPEELISKEGE